MATLQAEGFVPDDVMKKLQKFEVRTTSQSPRCECAAQWSESKTDGRVPPFSGIFG